MPTLTWIGKDAVEKHHLEIPYRLLEFDDALSAGDRDSGNLLVQGDNLHALKALLPYYAGKVKCIYIDPPYNTGNEKWQYNDNVNAPEIKLWLNKIVGTEGEDLSRHDKWLCMMYPRLQLLKKLLHKNGAIFISIDDNEQANLKLLMDEIFGANNFVCNIIWEKKYTVANDAKYLSDNHDFIICYAKNKTEWRPFKLPRPIELNKAYKNPDNHPKGPWKSTPLHAKSGSETTEVYSYTFKNGIIWSPPVGTYPRFSKDTLARFDLNNEIWFGKNGKSIPSRKTFLRELKSEGVTTRTIWKFEEAGHNHEAKEEVKKFSFSIVFDTPKPIKLLKRIILLSTDKNDLILDSFSGSGTTGNAVMELNKEVDGNRKFILVELEDKIAKEVAAERLKKVINGHQIQKQNGTLEQIEGLGGGFRYCKLAEPLFDQYGNIREGVTFKELAYHIYFSETGVPLNQKAKLDTSLIGKHKGIAYYLLFNGILKDKTADSGNVLTSKILEILPPHNGKKVIFGLANRLSTTRLNRENIVFKQIPIEIKTS